MATSRIDIENPDHSLERLVEVAEIRRETIQGAVSRAGWFVLWIVAVLQMHSCYEAKRRYDIIDRMQMPADQAPRQPSGKLRMPDLTE